MSNAVATGFVRESRDGVTLSVRVTPRAGRDEVVGVESGLLRVRLASPPVEGAANAALQALLARWLGVPRSDVTLLRGGASRVKLVAVRGRSADDVRRRLPAGGPPDQAIPG